MPGSAEDPGWGAAETCLGIASNSPFWDQLPDDQAWPFATVLALARPWRPLVINHRLAPSGPRRDFEIGLIAEIEIG